MLGRSRIRLARFAAVATAVGTPLLLAGCTPPPPHCSGVAMTHGQSDVDNHGSGTTFCLSGTHNWSLVPKNGDRFLGPATLNGGNATKFAFSGSAQNVTIWDLSIQHYASGDQLGAINPDSNTSGWTMLGLDVGYNSNSGIDPPSNSVIRGGRLHDNGQEGASAGGGSHNITVDGVEIDHNNTRHIDCGYEAGGFKWVANNVTVKNSSIHDNLCKGLWSDINSSNGVIQNNRIYDNSDEGVFVEISNHFVVSGNMIYGNGLRNYNGCGWVWGGGITAAASSYVDVYGNNVSGNCNGITGVQQDRPDGNPGLLEFFNVHDNTISGHGVSGAAADNGANLSTRHIDYTRDKFLNGQTFCGTNC